jgi:formamidopyrimidine-DNA glycosylase
MDALAPNELKKLFATMREVLNSAVARGAGSEQFADRMPKGALLPQRKKGGHCPRCGSPLKISKVAGRTAYCCPRCQNC